MSLDLIDHPHPLQGPKMIIKRFEDLIIASTLVFLLWPVIVIIIIAIKIESCGPVIFKQQRYGYGNSTFYIWKFRTMYSDLCDPTGKTQTSRDDYRITHTGKLLRRYSLDELPQLFNVIRGEMSIVGPRAHPVEMRVNNRLYGEAVANYAERHRVYPGLTGLAQVKGLRGEIDSIEKARTRVEFDLQYIEKWSLALDIKILIQTAILIFCDKHAY
jgi:lipopolysaccharide/colanic/teichoic acid biosynthesis glycosyltransferase